MTGIIPEDFFIQPYLMAGGGAFWPAARVITTVLTRTGRLPRQRSGFRCQHSGL
ncbi:MAG: hypothetical protein WKG07_31665 [Hymenobacter sp.]